MLERQERRVNRCPHSESGYSSAKQPGVPSRGAS